MPPHLPISHDITDHLSQLSPIWLTVHLKKTPFALYQHNTHRSLLTPKGGPLSRALSEFRPNFVHLPSGSSGTKALG